MKIKILKSYNRLLAFLLSFLGVVMTACEEIGGTNRAEYGAPYAEYQVLGTVTNQDEVGIEGIKVRLTEPEHVYAYDSTYTLSDGTYSLVVSMEFMDTLGIQFMDEAALYQNVDTLVSFTDAVFTNGDGWYQGEATVEFNVELK